MHRFEFCCAAVSIVCKVVVLPSHFDMTFGWNIFELIVLIPYKIYHLVSTMAASSSPSTATAFYYERAMARCICATGIINKDSIPLEIL